MDFVRSHFRKMQIWIPSWTLFSSQKGTCSTTIQLFRIAFFQIDFLQNPYFSRNHLKYFYLCISGQIFSGSLELWKWLSDEHWYMTHKRLSSKFRSFLIHFLILLFLYNYLRGESVSRSSSMSDRILYGIIKAGLHIEWKEACIQ